MRTRDNETMMDPVSEARRYVANAHTLLIKKAGLNPETQLYRDRKYVRMAGNTLWNGMLLILDATFNIDKTQGRISIKDYRTIIGKRDRKLLDYVNVAYDTMHLAMGYDGNLEKSICQKGIQLANEIIDRCERLIL